MKNNKYIQTLFVGLTMMVGFTACEDRDPVYQAPESTDSFVLNIPPLADQYYELTEGGTIDLTWSAFDYGYAAVANYAVEASLNENFDPAEQVATTTVCNASIKQASLALAICSMRGIEDVASYVDEPARNVYFRVKSSLKNVEGSEVISNTIKFSQIKEYCAIKEAGYIYLVGTPTGWVEPNSAAAATYENWKLIETEIGNNIYSGVFNLAAGDHTFRFYASLGGWGSDSALPSLGAHPVDNNTVAVKFTDKIYSGPVFEGKGSWVINGWEGGNLKLTVNMSNPDNMTVTMEVGGIDVTGKAFIYLVGAPEGWAGPDEANASHYESWKLYDMEGNGVYTTVKPFEIAAGSFMFRFYTALTGWDQDSYGAQEADSPIDIALTDGVYSGKGMKGKGSWNCPDWAGGKLDIAVDMNTNTVTFTQK